MLTGQSTFCQCMQFINDRQFAKSVDKYQSDHYSKKFSSREHLTAMLFLQLSQSKSLREICYGLQSLEKKLNHIGLKQPPKKSTISYANKHRNPDVFKETFFNLLYQMQHQQGLVPQHKFKFKNKLYSLDASIIQLCIKSFDWAHYRTHKGAVKLHLMLDHDGCLPVFANLTDGKKHEVKIAQEMTFPKGAIIAMDRGYNGYNLFNRLSNDGVFFVTRIKQNARYKELKNQPLPCNKRHLLEDVMIQIKGVKYRLVTVFDEANEMFLELLTNNFKLSADTIGKIYKDRWKIETFFRNIKQNLKIKTFVGTSENAVLIQFWTALITILILSYLKFKSTFNWSLSNLVALLRLNLFAYKDLWGLLNNPFSPPPETPPDRQMEFKFM